MDNKTKQCFSSLDVRLAKIEYMFEIFAQEIKTPQMFIAGCRQCGVTVLEGDSYICGQTDCPKGLNPEDDN